jgi:SAM-dependent methyltransferase
MNADKIEERDFYDATIPAWERHYARPRSMQEYPDENLVRLVKRFPLGPVLDYGCGSGRHIHLLLNEGFTEVYGTDISQTALRSCSELYPDIRFIMPDEIISNDGGFRLPFEDESLAAIIAWGVLHYNSEEAIRSLLQEFARVLRPGGVLAGTLRAAGDTHFRSNTDMADVRIATYELDEARALISSQFPQTDFGYAERSPVGELSRKICHWLFFSIR